MLGWCSRQLPAHCPSSWLVVVVTPVRCPCLCGCPSAAAWCLAVYVVVVFPVLPPLYISPGLVRHLEVHFPSRRISP